MQIMYRTTRHTREVADSIGRRLVASRIADAVSPAKAGEVTKKYLDRAATADSDADARDEEVENTRRTGKPKRKYKRKDLRAED